MDSERWTAPLLVSYLNAGISLLFVQKFPRALNCTHIPKVTRKLNFLHLPNSSLNLKFSHLIILFFFQYVCPSHPPRPCTQRGNYTSQHETYKSTYFTLRRTLEGRRRIPSIFPATPLSSLRASARIQNIFWDMSHIKQQPLGSQSYSSNPRPQQNNSYGGNRTTDNNSKRKDTRKCRSNHFDHYKISIKPPSKKKRKPYLLPLFCVNVT